MVNCSKQNCLLATDQVKRFHLLYGMEELKAS